MNHFKSKGGSGTNTDKNIGDQSGNWNDRRTNAAEAVLACVLERFFRCWTRVRFVSSHFLYDLITLRTLILQLFLSTYPQIMWHI